ncbi:MAG TPA: hypothetical protein VFX28_24910, partial [Methylomirabilota bacterium]|nr:hypothetical protein [Methylomirabilota bacterium]
MDIVWRDGEFVDRRLVTFAVDAPVVSYSHAVLDACRVVVLGAPPAGRARMLGLSAHVARFQASCA